MENTLPDFLIEEEPVEAKVVSLDKPIVFPIADKQIEKYRDDYMGLGIQGPDDKEGYKRVYEARQIVKKARVTVDKKRKDLNADANAYIKKVNDEAKRITGLLLPIETHLETQEVAYERERQRIKIEKELAQQRLVETRINRLRALDCVYNSQSETYSQYGHHVLTLENIKELSENDFEDIALSIEESYHAEQARLAEQKRKQEEEAARIAAEKAEAERQLSELRRQQAEAAEQLRKQQEELEAMRREQEEKQKLIEAERRETERVAAEAARREALRPDAAKLTRLADMLENLDYPLMSTEGGEEILRSTAHAIGVLVEGIRERVAAL